MYHVCVCDEGLLVIAEVPRSHEVRRSQGAPHHNEGLPNVGVSLPADMRIVWKF